MYIYSVTINISKEAEQEWVDFMQHKHIADVLKTGYFIHASMRKGITSDETEAVTYNMEYTAKTQEDYTNYQQHAAAALQKDVAERFAGKFTAQRAFYQLVFEL
jgi:Domain of unknown function (DUF4286)